MKVTALAESGERGDHFEISRGRALPDGPASVAGGAAVVPAVEGSLQGGGGILALRLGRAVAVSDAADSRLGHGGSTP
jgi:hypothetical protein